MKKVQYFTKKVVGTPLFLNYSTVILYNDPGTDDFSQVLRRLILQIPQITHWWYKYNKVPVPVKANLRQTLRSMKIYFKKYDVNAGIPSFADFVNTMRENWSCSNKR